ncbi:DUF3050 domain-containing protein [Adhaeribacter aquaticus]|uniref:DUF3050 domain-containing protein n=1 Tax=Adhaeribacter aquaticus TaxID=299567 RepID=UPI00040ED7B1|nr:DUF3050 domain-containing protein [Adhaeribacter aquaticus]
MNLIAQIKTDIEPLRQALLNHPIYSQIKTVPDLNIFLEHHIFAVWDFMSLLKALQRDLTCVEVPWVPKGNPVTRRLVNEIVMGEETDVDANGKPASHYELYLEAMAATQANTEKINQLLSLISSGSSVKEALAQLPVAEAVRDFVQFSFDTIANGKTHEIASIFTFGREDLIPDMFSALVQDLHQHFPKKLEKLVYYLDRHIELDADEHGPMAMLMISELCQADETKWEECRVVAITALQKRIALWDSIATSIQAKK